MNLYLGIVSCVLLALVAGLLLTVGLWLYEFRQNYKKAPLLGEELTRQLMAARDALANLQKTAREAGPELAKAVGAAQTLKQDLDFLVARAEKVAEKLDESTATTGKAPKAPKVPAAEGGKVVSENVVAAASASRDPLEELLAGLGSEAQPPAPPPQPELNLAPPPAPPAAEVKLRRTLAG